MLIFSGFSFSILFELLDLCEISGDSFGLFVSFFISPLKRSFYPDYTLFWSLPVNYFSFSFLSFSWAFFSSINFCCFFCSLLSDIIMITQTEIIISSTRIRTEKTMVYILAFGFSLADTSSYAENYDFPQTYSSQIYLATKRSYDSSIVPSDIFSISLQLMHSFG